MEKVKANKGFAGVYVISIGDIENTGVGQYLGEIQSELMNDNYKQRLVVRDRIMQMET